MVVPELCIGDPSEGGDAKILDDAFNELGYEIEKWFENETYAGALMRLGEQGASAIKNELALEDPGTFYVSGHAIFIPMIASALASDDMPNFAHQMRKLKLNEAGVIKLELDDNGKVVTGEVQN